MSSPRLSTAHLSLSVALLLAVACTSEEEQRFAHRSALDEQARAAQEHRARVADEGDAALDEAMDELPAEGTAPSGDGADDTDGVHAPPR